VTVRWCGGTIGTALEFAIEKSWV